MQKTDYVVVGLGQTGIACAKYLLKQGFSVAVTDSRMDPPGLAELKQIAPNIEVECGALSEKLIQQADCLVMSPGVSLQEDVIAKAIKNGMPFVGDIELFSRAVKVPMIGITGSNGKSTVTTLVGEMAKAAGKKVIVAGNIGVPVLEICEEAKQAELIVLELSSFQLETTHDMLLVAATILNLSDNHMDRYQNLQEYGAAKQRIYRFAKNGIYNRQDSYTVPKEKGLHLMSFGNDAPLQDGDYGLLEENGQIFIMRGKEKLIAEKELYLQGGHNLLNAQAALALGEAAGLPLAVMLPVLKTFKGLPHRCEFVVEKNGVRWYNDSKATTVAATLAALKTLGSSTQKNVVLIAGGVGKEADFSPLKPAVEKYVKELILIGVDADDIQKACNGATVIKRAATLNDAIAAADQAAKNGNIVLLAPACASFDMFKSYVHRGEVFKQRVQEYLYDKVN